MYSDQSDKYIVILWIVKITKKLSLLQNLPFSKLVYPVSRCGQAFTNQESDPDAKKSIEHTSKITIWSNFTPSFTKPWAYRT